MTEAPDRRLMDVLDAMEEQRRLDESCVLRAWRAEQESLRQSQCAHLCRFINDWRRRRRPSHAAPLTTAAGSRGSECGEANNNSCITISSLSASPRPPASFLTDGTIMAGANAERPLLFLPPAALGEALGGRGPLLGDESPTAQESANESTNTAPGVGCNVSLSAMSPHSTPGMHGVTPTSARQLPQGTLSKAARPVGGEALATSGCIIRPSYRDGAPMETDADTQESLRVALHRMYEESSSLPITNHSNETTERGGALRPASAGVWVGSAYHTVPRHPIPGDSAMSSPTMALPPRGMLEATDTTSGPRAMTIEDLALELRRLYGA